MNQADVEHSFDSRIECGEPIATFLFKSRRQRGSLEIPKKLGGHRGTHSRWVRLQEYCWKL